MFRNDHPKLQVGRQTPAMGKLLSTRVISCYWATEVDVSYIFKLTPYARKSFVHNGRVISNSQDVKKANCPS